jgi:hypothetical protein
MGFQNNISELGLGRVITRRFSPARVKGGAVLLSVAEAKEPLMDYPIGKMCQVLPLARAEKVGADE